MRWRQITTLAAARTLITQPRIRGFEERSWRREVEKPGWRYKQEQKATASGFGWTAAEPAQERDKGKRKDERKEEWDQKTAWKVWNEKNLTSATVSTQTEAAGVRVYRNFISTSLSSTFCCNPVKAAFPQLTEPAASSC